MKTFIRMRRGRAILAGMALAAGSAAWAALEPGDSPEVREIKAQFARQAARVESLEVSYKLDTRSDLKPSQLLALSAFRNQLFLPNDDWAEAFKGEKRFRRQVQPERVQYLAETDEFGLVPPQRPDPKAPANIQENQKRLKAEYDRAVAMMKAQEARGVPRRKKDPGALDPSERDVTRGYNGRAVWMRRPRDGKVHEIQTWSLRPNMHWFGMSAYLSAVGLQPADPTAKGHPVQQAQEMFRLADWFGAHSYSMEKTEVVDGSTCVVLKGSLNSLVSPSLLAGDLADRIWLDRDHGWAVRKREMSKGGVVHTRWENTDLREVAPGFWLPTVVRHFQFAEDAPAEWAGKPVVVEEIRVQQLEVNKVADDRFDVVPGKDDVIEDLRGSR